MDVLTEGFSQPWAGPLYAEPPFYYREGRVILALWEADSARVATILPQGVEPLEDPVVCIAWVSTFPFSTFGPYNEAVLIVRVQLEGQGYHYTPFLYVDNEAPLAAGREIWGFCKKFADIRFDYGGQGPGYREQFLFTVDRPANKRLLTVNLSCDRPGDVGELPRLPLLSLRKIPNCEAGKPPSICELVRTDLELVVNRTADGTPNLWAGRCSVTMDSPSEHDPLYKMAPTRWLGGFYGTFDWTLPQGRSVKNYLEAAVTAAG